MSLAGLPSVAHHGFTAPADRPPCPTGLAVPSFATIVELAVVRRRPSVASPLIMQMASPAPNSPPKSRANWSVVPDEE
jgi:hypothetical protein